VDQKVPEEIFGNQQCASGKELARKRREEIASLRSQ